MALSGYSCIVDGVLGVYLANIVDNNPEVIVPGAVLLKVHNRVIGPVRRGVDRRVGVEVLLRVVLPLDRHVHTHDVCYLKVYK